MAERELRRMNRMELIEIIYALKQHEEELERQNDKLRRQLADRTLRLEQVGSIAEAALSLNRYLKPHRLRQINIWNRSRRSTLCRAPSFRPPRITKGHIGNEGTERKTR